MDDASLSVLSLFGAASLSWAPAIFCSKTAPIPAPTEKSDKKTVSFLRKLLGLEVFFRRRL
jgi:hypothetical protein